MPLYLYKCPTCSAQREIMKPLAELDRTEHCHKCDFAMNRQVVAPAVRGDYPPYECPVTGKVIEGRRAHEENLKRTGCRVWEPGETELVRRKASEREAEFDRAVGETVEEAIHKMPVEKREKLVGELEGGMGLSVQRSTPNMS